MKKIFLLESFYQQRWELGIRCKVPGVVPNRLGSIRSMEFVQHIGLVRSIGFVQHIGLVRSKGFVQCYRIDEV